MKKEGFFRKLIEWLLPQTKEHQKNHKFYFVLYIGAEVLFVLSLGSLIFSVWPSSDCVWTLKEWLSRWFRPEAMSAVVSMVGFSGAVITWLISRIEDRTCGLRMSELVEWAYPNFFILYFFLFTSFSILAVFSGGARLFWPTFYAFLGTLLALAQMWWVCYRFVIRTDLREEYAFECYKDRLSHLTGGDKEKQIRKLLLDSSDYARFLYTREHREVQRQTLDLWLKAFPCEGSSRKWKSCLVCWGETPDELIYRADIYSTAWAALLPEGIEREQDAALFIHMLEELDEKKNRDDCPNRQAILLGLAQFWMENQWLLREDRFRRLCVLADRKKESRAFRELMSACLVMLSVEWVAKAPEAKRILALAVREWYPLLERSLPRKEESGGAYLLHACWTARRARNMKGWEYLLRVSQLLSLASDTGSHFLAFVPKGKDERELERELEEWPLNMCSLLLAFAEEETEREEWENERREQSLLAVYGAEIRQGTDPASHRG